MGLEKFCKVARLAGVDGILAIDLPVEESADYVHAAKANGLSTIFLAAPTSTDHALKYCEASTGFVYAVSRTGVTGSAQTNVKPMPGIWFAASANSPRFPIAVGFGISTPEQFAAVGTFRRRLRHRQCHCRDH